MEYFLAFIFAGIIGSTANGNAYEEKVLLELTLSIVALSAFSSCMESIPNDIVVFGSSADDSSNISVPIKNRYHVKMIGHA